MASAQAFFHQEWNKWAVGYYYSGRASADSYTQHSSESEAEREAKAFNDKEAKLKAARAKEDAERSKKKVEEKPSAKAWASKGGALANRSSTPATTTVDSKKQALAESKVKAIQTEVSRLSRQAAIQKTPEAWKAAAEQADKAALAAAKAADTFERGSPKWQVWEGEKFKFQGFAKAWKAKAGG